MKLKSRRKPVGRTLPLAAVGAGLAALGGLIAFLSSRNRRDQAKGAFKNVTAPIRHSRREYDDVTLARKVESEILGAEDAPKGSVVVNARDGVVELRGQVKRPDQVTGLGEAAGKVAGVKGVNNLLHTAGSEPKTSPPSDPAEVRERAEHN